MKKKLILCLSTCLLCCFIFTQPTKAEEYYYEEVIEIIDSTPVTRATNTITGKKTAYVKNSDNVLWTVTVTGTFTYTGTKATCTKSSVSTSVKDSRWKISSSSHSKSGNTAKATAIAKYYLDGSVVSTVSKTVTLTCSASGKLS